MRRPLRVTDLARHLPVLAVVAAGLVVTSTAGHAPLRLVGLVTSVAAYLTLRRWAVWGWLAALAALPGAVGTGLLDLPSGVPAWGSALLAVAVAAALTAGVWRAWATGLGLVVVVGVTLVGAVAWWSVGSGRPARPDWGSAAAFFLLALPAAVGLLAASGVARAVASPPLRLACAALALAPLAALLVSGGDALAALTWWPAAGALGATAMLRGRRGPGVRRPQSDAIDAGALQAFADRYGRPRLAPVAIVIAAYNEADGLPGVLAGLPRQVCGLPADVVVVDDGSTDGTATAAGHAADEAGHGYVVACPANRGQGAALRLGYRVARQHGAAYVVTTDADGQYAVAELDAVLRPVVDDRADFVTGSRRLGALHNHDRVRQVGTYVFAWLASALLGRHLTDTSFGLRAMRAEVTAAVALNQPQYQASELLVSVASHGFRVLEVPGTMQVRSAGSSKKGRNLVYGSRYARVMLGTWWREGAPRPVTEVAPALDAG